MKAWISRLAKTAKKQEEGLTLIELLAVVTILGIIAAVAVPITLSAIDKSKEKTTMAEVAELQTALDRYAQDHDGTYPDGLSSVLSDYMSQFDGTDAWGTSITYSVTHDAQNGDSFTIWAPKTSGGAHGVTATNKIPPHVVDITP